MLLHLAPESDATPAPFGHRYGPSGLVAIRVAMAPFDTYAEVHALSTCERIRYAAENEAIMAALEVASPSLAGHVQQVAAGADVGEAARRRLDSRLLRYLCRIAVRATPFGAFAGVGTCELVDEPTPMPTLGDVRARVRPDYAWLCAAAENQASAAGPSREVRVNTLLREEGPWWVIDSADAAGARVGEQRVRVRRNAVAQSVLVDARSPRRVDGLVEALTARYPGQPSDGARYLVEQLEAHGVLVGAHRPGLHGVDPSSCARHHLPGEALIGTGDAPVVLADVFNKSEELSRRPPRRADLLELSSMQRRLTPSSGPTYQLDTTVQLSGGVPRRVADDVADAVDVLLALAPAQAAWDTHLATWRARLERTFGVGTLVPVQTVLSPITGIGAPAGYTEPGDTCLDPHPQRRAEGGAYYETVFAFAAEALVSGSRSVELTDEWVHRLGAGLGTGPVAPTVDAYVEYGRDEDGNDVVVMRPDGMSLGGRSLGRFHDVVSGEALERLGEIAHAEMAFRPNAIHAELVYAPQHIRAGNVSTRPRTRPFEIAVNVEPSTDAESLDLAELCIGSNGTRLFVWSTRHEREVVVTEGHLLPLAGAPNVCRLLVEASSDGVIQPAGFGWGPVAGAPSLPRVVRGNVVLRPAQWSLRRDLLDHVEAAGGEPDVAAALTGWRHRWSVPRFVHLSDGDHRLLLDLDSSDCLAELSAEIERSGGPVVVQEMLPTPDMLWLKDSAGRVHVSELVVTVVALGNAPLASPGIDVSTGRVLTDGRHTDEGERWINHRIYLQPGDADTVLVDRLYPAMEELGEAAQCWFFTRHEDPLPHVALRVLPAPDRGDDVSRHVHAVIAALVAERLARESSTTGYVPESVHFGGPASMPAVEALFCANSVAALHLLDWWRSEATTALPLSLMAMAAVDVTAEHLGLDAATRVRIGAFVAAGQSDESYRRFRDLAVGLAGSTSNKRHFDGAELREIVRDILDVQALPARRVGEILRAQTCQAHDEAATRLLRLTINRLMPNGGLDEREVMGLWHRAARAAAGAKPPQPNAEAASHVVAQAVRA